jgi:hypothetical protein
VVAWDGTKKPDYGKYKGVPWRDVSGLYLNEFLANNDTGAMVEEARQELHRRAEVAKTQKAPFITYDRHMAMYKQAYDHQRMTTFEVPKTTNDDDMFDSLTPDQKQFLYGETDEQGNPDSNTQL